MSESVQLNYKTKSYVLRAVRNYYNKNKSLISSKNHIKAFKNKIDILLDTIIELDNPYIQMNYLHRIASYKLYQTNLEVRNEFKDRINLIVDKLRNEDNHSDFDCLRLDTDDISYNGNYGKK